MNEEEDKVIYFRPVNDTITVQDQDLRKYRVKKDELIDDLYSMSYSNYK